MGRQRGLQLSGRSPSRFYSERAAAEQTQADLNLSYEDASQTLDPALQLTRCVQAAYQTAGAIERRFFNQAFFERLEIPDDEVTCATLAQPFFALFDEELIEALATPEPTAGTLDGALEPSLVSVGVRNDRTPGILSAEGSSRDKMVELIGGLSNPEFQQKLREMSEIAARHAHREARAPEPRARKQRVSEALAAVLAAGANKPMRVVDLHRAVEDLIASPVPRSTIKNDLLATRFERVSRGPYRLARAAGLESGSAGAP